MSVTRCSITSYMPTSADTTRSAASSITITIHPRLSAVW